MKMEGEAMPEKPNNNSQKPRTPNFLPCWPPVKTSQKEPGKSKNPFDDLLATQKAAEKKANEYKSKIRTGFTDLEAIECFFFYCKYQDYDKQGRLRKKLLRQVDDLSLVSIFDTCRQMPISLARLIESRFRPQESRGN